MCACPSECVCVPLYVFVLVCVCVCMRMCVCICSISVLHILLPVQAVISAVDDTFYKITSEALLVLRLIVKTIRPLGEWWIM